MTGYLKHQCNMSHSESTVLSEAIVFVDKAFCQPIATSSYNSTQLSEKLIGIAENRK